MSAFAAHRETFSKSFSSWERDFAEKPARKLAKIFGSPFDFSDFTNFFRPPQKANTKIKSGLHFPCWQCCKSAATAVKMDAKLNLKMEAICQLLLLQKMLLEIMPQGKDEEEEPVHRVSHD